MVFLENVLTVGLKMSYFSRGSRGQDTRNVDFFWTMVI